MYGYWQEPIKKPYQIPRFKIPVSRLKFITSRTSVNRVTFGFEYISFLEPSGPPSERRLAATRMNRGLGTTAAAIVRRFFTRQSFLRHLCCQRSVLIEVSKKKIKTNGLRTSVRTNIIVQVTESLFG